MAENTLNEVELRRDCNAVLIPAGTHVSLPQGSVVLITQALGGSYTVNVNGNLVRIDSEDADALGFDKSSHQPDLQSKTLKGDGKVDEQLIWDQLHTCYDPEIPIDIVELGLIYECVVSPVENGNRVDIVMTLTAPGCGMGDFLVEDVRRKVSGVENVTDIHVTLSFDPPWNQDMMSEAARLAVGMY